MKNILLVDDEEDIRVVVGMMIESIGHNVIEAACAESAFKKLTDDIHLVVSNHILPKKNGIDFYLEDVKQKGIPFVLVTGAEVTSNKKIMNLSSDSQFTVFTKPFYEKDLRTLLEGLV